MNMCRDSRDKLLPASDWLYEGEGCFFGPEPSYWDEAGTGPIQARTVHAASAWGAEGTSCGLCLATLAALAPKDCSV